jgi:hypothetical protein
LDRRLGGPQSRSGRGDEEKNSQTPFSDTCDLCSSLKGRNHVSHPCNINAEIIAFYIPLVFLFHKYIALQKFLAV